MEATREDLQGKPITIKCTGLKPIYTTTITSAAGDLIASIERNLDANQGGCVPTVRVTLLAGKDKERSQIATTDKLQLEIEGIAEVAP